MVRVNLSFRPAVGRGADISSNKEGKTIILEKFLFYFFFPSARERKADAHFVCCGCSGGDASLNLYRNKKLKMFVGIVVFQKGGQE